MNALVCTIPTLAVSSIYCIWHAHLLRQRRRERILCERVTYMLWVTANTVEFDNPVQTSTLGQRQEVDGAQLQEPQ